MLFVPDANISSYSSANPTKEYPAHSGVHLADYQNQKNKASHQVMQEGLSTGISHLQQDWGVMRTLVFTF